MYSLCKELPPSGAFLMIWTYNNEVWSRKYRWEKDGGLMEYNHARDSYIYSSTDSIRTMIAQPNVTKVYYVVSGDF